jgi:hypothetical protein
MHMECEEARTLLINIDTTEEDERTSYTISEQARCIALSSLGLIVEVDTLINSTILGTRVFT